MDVKVKAKIDYLKGMKYKDIADKYEVSINTVKSWVKRYGWAAERKRIKEKGAPKNTRGAPFGNQNAKGNKGGPGGPIGNKKAEKHGFFSRIFPDDPETQEIVESIEQKSPLDILWENIVIQYTAIARAQKLMFVKDQDDIIREVTMETSGVGNDTTAYLVQTALDKQATFLQAQSRAITALQNLIARYDAMLPGALQYEEQRLRIEKLKAEIAKITGADEATEDDGFIEALQTKAAEVWDDEA